VTFVEILGRNGDKLALVVGGAGGFGKTIDPSWPQYVAFTEHHAIDKRFEVFVIRQRDGLAKIFGSMYIVEKMRLTPLGIHSEEQKLLKLGLLDPVGVFHIAPYQAVAIMVQAVEKGIEKYPHRDQDMHYLWKWEIKS
jgi:hypothetical protein